LFSKKAEMSEGQVDGSGLEKLRGIVILLDMSTHMSFSVSRNHLWVPLRSESISTSFNFAACSSVCYFPIVAVATAVI